jgi:hypothetical protein
VEVETDLGEVGAPVRVERGVYQAPLIVPSALRGNRAILVLVKAEGVSATRSLPLAPGEPASVVVTPPGVVSADGSTTAQLEVTITDSFDNPSEDAPEGEARYGEFGPASRLGPGRWVLPYRPRRLLEDTKDTLVVRSGPASTSLDVDLIAPRISFNVAAKIGLDVAAGQAGLALGAEASAWTQLGRAQLGLALDGSWWQLSRSSQVTVGGSPAAYQSDQSYVPILLAVAWRLPLGQRAMLWTSLGGGGAWVSSNTQLAGQPSISESGLAPAATLAVSFGWQVWRGFPFVELRLTWVGDPGLATLSGSLTPFFLFAGYRFDAG